MKQVLAILVVGLMSVVPFRATGQIVINEIMYNSKDSDVEFIELYNNSTSTVDLAGWYLLDDNDNHTRCLLNGSLAAGQYLLVAGDVTLFHAQYPTVTNVNANAFNAGGNGWAFGNGGDVARLYNNAGVLQDNVAYLDGGDWPGQADGNGPSLELINPNLDNALSGSWDPSMADGGTPGSKNSVFAENVAPVCKDGARNIGLPKSSDAVGVTVVAYDAEGLTKVELFVDAGSGYIAQAMYDNGLNGDATAGDSTYTTMISSRSGGTIVRYYAVATDNAGQTDTWPSNAPTEYHAYTVDYVPPALCINEILAANDSGLRDEFGDYDDWFEIRNKGVVPVNLAGMYVSDDLGVSRAFELPSVVIDPNGYLLLWADGEPEQGSLHANFKLSADGEAVGLFETVDHGNVLINGWKFGVMSPNVSMGFFPETGNAPEYLAVPTPGASNEASTLFSPVCINEFQSTSDFGGPDDWVEIYNRGTAPYNLAGCFISDERSVVAKWTFPSSAVLNPGNYLVVYEDVLGFSFSSSGDDVIMLTAADSTTGLDFYDFGPQTADHSEGRDPDGTNNWAFFYTPTRGATNNGQSAVDQKDSGVALHFSLQQNYPNPFNPATTISFSLSRSGEVSLRIYDLLGKEIATLVDGRLDAGEHSFQWQADGLSSGIYHVRMVSSSFHQTRKMLLLK